MNDEHSAPSLLDRAKRLQAERLLDEMSGEEQAAILAEMDPTCPDLRARNSAIKAAWEDSEARDQARKQRQREVLRDAKRARRPAPKTAAERMRDWRASHKGAPAPGPSADDIKRMEKKVAVEGRARLAALEKAIDSASKSDRRLSRITPDTAKNYVSAWVRREVLRFALGHEPSMGEIVEAYAEGKRPSRQAIHNRLRQVELLEASDVWRVFRDATV